MSEFKRVNFSFILDKFCFFVVIILPTDLEI